MIGAGNGRTIAETAHDDELSFSRSVTDGRAHCRRKESPMSSPKADLITIIIDRAGPDELKPC
jgi:hypothetical protein